MNLKTQSKDPMQKFDETARIGSSDLPQEATGV